MRETGVGRWDVPVPTYVNIAIKPRTLKIGSLVIIQLPLQFGYLTLYLTLLVQ